MGAERPQVEDEIAADAARNRKETEDAAVALGHTERFPEKPPRFETVEELEEWQRKQAEALAESMRQAEGLEGQEFKASEGQRKAAEGRERIRV